MAWIIQVTALGWGYPDDMITLGLQGGPIVNILKLQGLAK